MSITEQEYLHQGRLIAEEIERAEEDVAEAQDALDDLRGKQVALQEAWRAKRRKFAELPYGAGDIVRFEKASFVSNRTRDYTVTEVTVDKVWVETTEGHAHSFDHDEAETVGITVVRKAAS